MTFASHVAPEAPARIVGDSQRLRQVLVNLVSNAIKFTERGEVVVSVQPVLRLPTPLRNRRVCAFTVRDTGIGIDANKQRLIFDAFTQADGSTSRRFGGTGLGLSISRRLVEMMGGRLDVSSDAGTGGGLSRSTCPSISIRLPKAPMIRPRPQAWESCLPRRLGR